MIVAEGDVLVVTDKDGPALNGDTLATADEDTPVPNGDVPATADRDVTVPADQATLAAATADALASVFFLVLRPSNVAFFLLIYSTFE